MQATVVIAPIFIVVTGFHTESIFTWRQVEKRYVMFIRIYPFFVNTVQFVGI